PPEEVREAALALPRLPEPPEQVEVLDPQDALVLARVVEHGEAALLPLAEVAHARDQPLSGEPPHVVAFVEVAVDRIAVVDEAVVYPLPDQRRLAGARRPDHRDRTRPRARQQIR